MPTLIDGVSTRFSTDFYAIQAVQQGVGIDPGASFAGSSPGVVSLEAGYKEAHVSMRAERWDARPVDVDGWEDIDDIPFVEVHSAGALMLRGFDEGTVGLDLASFGSGRVQVLARGRHRFDPGSAIDLEAVEPEEWLLRFYPVEGAPDPMAGGPRRLAAGGGQTRAPRSPWLAAVHGFTTTGWADVLSGSHGFAIAQLALWTSTAPLNRLDLARRMVQRMPPYEMGGPDSESTLVPPRVSRRGDADALATLSGRAQIGTVGEVIDALHELGLLLVEVRDGENLLVPNPSPRLAWEQAGLTGDRLVRARSRALEREHPGIATTISFAVWWCGERGLSATPRAMAIRWCVSVDDVVGGLRFLGGVGRVRADRELTFNSELDPDEPITLWKAEKPRVGR